MQLIAHTTDVGQLNQRLHSTDVIKAYRFTQHVDLASGDVWFRTHLGAEDHGGGMPVFIRDAVPTLDDLLELVKLANDSATVAASSWLLSELDVTGDYKSALLDVAERAASGGDHRRAALVVGWGNLRSEMNLRTAIGKASNHVTADHEYFRAIAKRAREVLRLTLGDSLLRDPQVFA